MSSDEIKDLAKQVGDALLELQHTQEALEFYMRVLRQAVLTHGGELRVDPAFSKEASSCKLGLEICSGGVRLL